MFQPLINNVSRRIHYFHIYIFHLEDYHEYEPVPLIINLIIRLLKDYFYSTPGHACTKWAT